MTQLLYLSTLPTAGNYVESGFRKLDLDEIYGLNITLKTDTVGTLELIWSNQLSGDVIITTDSDSITTFEHNKQYSLKGHYVNIKFTNNSMDNDNTIFILKVNKIINNTVSTLPLNVAITSGSSSGGDASAANQLINHTKLDTVNTNLGTIETDIESTNAKLDTVNTNLGTIETDIESTNTKLTDLNDYMYKSLTNDLKYLRSAGYCYITNHSRSVSGSTSPDGLIQIWNNNSNYKVYVYNVFFDLSSSDSDNGYTQFSIYKCNARATSGSYPPVNNLKLYGPNKPSGIDIISNPAGSGLTFSSSDRIQVIASRFAPTQNQDFIRENDFQEEMIEVPYGKGIIFAANAGNAYQSLYHSATIRFLILPVSTYPDYPRV